MHEPLVSYAQNREDLFLWSLVGHRTPGVYVDVGCFDEQAHSVTRMFYERGWSGLNIDANADFAEGYRRRERDHFVHCGVGAEPGEATFRLYPRHGGLSTFDEGIKQMHQSAGYPYRDVTVQVRTLDDILDEYGVDRIDFLKIDVEGSEPEVLRGLDLGRRRPTVIVQEASRIPASEPALLASGYHREFFDALNVYYVDDEATDVTIWNFAGAVLTPGFLTGREHDLVEELERRRAASARETASFAATDLVERGRRGLDRVRSRLASVEVLRTARQRLRRH